MKKVVLLILVTCFIQVSFSQTNVAVIEPIVEDGVVSTIEKAILRSKLMSSITNKEVGYEAFSRADIDAIMREQNFQYSGIVDDATRLKLGSLGGVDCLCISKLAEGGGYLNIEVYLVNVQTGRIENTANKLILKDIPSLESAAVELGKQLVGLDVLEQQRAALIEQQRQLELQRQAEIERQRQQQILEQQQLEQNLSALGQSFEALGDAIVGYQQAKNSYYIVFWNQRSSPRRITMNGQDIGIVPAYSSKQFHVSLNMQGTLKAIQTKDYLFSPNIETYTIKGVKAGQVVKLTNK